MSVVEFDQFPIDGVAVIAGAATALVAVRAEDGVKRPMVEHLGWSVSAEPHQVWGHFHYFRFRIRGRLLPDWCHDPGQCRIRLAWRGLGSFAKWDELAEPGIYDPGGGFSFQV